MTTYTLNLAFNNDMDLSVEDENFESLLEFYGDKLKGDKKWLITQLRAAVGGAENGESVRTVMLAMNGEVLSSETTDQSAPSADTGGSDESTSSAATSRTARPSKADPWADEDPGPDEPTADDPWSDDTETPAKPQKAAQSRPAASKPAAESESGLKKSRDKFDREWVIGLPEAPECNCGDPAARVKAKAKSSGKWFTTFKCAKGAPGGDWKEKCDFSEFPD